MLKQGEYAAILVSTLACTVQAMSIETHAFSVQYHVEITPTTVSEWGEIPEYKSALEKQLGQGALERINNETNNNIKDMNRYSRTLYGNWKQTVFS